jgi:hypothetical protein
VSSLTSSAVAIYDTSAAGGGGKGGGEGGGDAPSFGALLAEIPSFEAIILLRRRERWRVEEVQRGRLGGVLYVIRGISKSVRPLCHQEVDAGMKDRRENIPFWGLITP